MTQSDLEPLIKLLEYKIHLAKGFINEPNPDWLNQHDYSSGFYMGSRYYAKESVDFLEHIRERLVELVNKPSTNEVLEAKEHIFAYSLGYEHGYSIGHSDGIREE